MTTMPIRPDLRWFYRTPRWIMARARILARAGGRFTLLGEYLGGARCEQCGLMDGHSYFNWATARTVIVQIGIAHIDHEDFDLFHDDDNLLALCRRCHLREDVPFHRRTRELNKDRRRPLLQEIGA